MVVMISGGRVLRVGKGSKEGLSVVVIVGVSITDVISINVTRRVDLSGKERSRVKDMDDRPYRMMTQSRNQNGELL